MDRRLAQNLDHYLTTQPEDDEEAGMENDFSTSTLCEIGEAIQGASHVLAQVQGVKIAADRIREKAGEAWKLRNDDEARLYRDLADELDGVVSSRLRASFDDTYMPRERAAFDELQRRDDKESK